MSLDIRTKSSELRCRTPKLKPLPPRHLFTAVSCVTPKVQETKKKKKINNKCRAVENTS